MLATCVSTVRSVSQSRRAMPRLVRPSATSASTSRSRGVRAARWSVARSGLSSSETTSGSSAEPPFATRVRHYWFWESHRDIPSWYSAPWVNFLGWFVATLGILAFATPWLINKQPVKQPTDYHPLTLWVLLNIYFATGNVLEQQWLAVAFSLVAWSPCSLVAL